ncbi:hypothetical protein HIM_04371 [Hirsutella minnesotensis 3608]|uniref:Uncharacterized protein n=1 Tax=Hirsutella minnesotensis 3608 TaxID=1043627 RepID=A0A0F8A615_9HYPO|nr:hypothetical protein HIM_04371 [Hirsutella minnesotensis 3608]
MAFQQPTRQIAQRAHRPAVVDEPGATALHVTSLDRQPLESQSWVLFSPPTEVTTTSYLSGTDQSLPTPGRSQLSDLGSVNTAARSSLFPDAGPAPSFSAVDDAVVDDDAELDSLDSHLPEFRSLPGTQEPSQPASQQAFPVLPTHDGLGSFRLSDEPILGKEAQDQIYQFERYNPRRVRRRLDSFSRGQLDLEHNNLQEQEKRMRIEAWRLDHSRTLLDEVQRETRRRRKSQVSIERLRRPSTAESDNMTWHDEDHIRPEEEEEGIIASITRKLVKDLLGLDDKFLDLIFGGSPPKGHESSNLPRTLEYDDFPFGEYAESSWNAKLVETLSQELGFLVNRVSHHPGAFSTYVRSQQLPLPYAGLPVIPESVDTPQASKLMDTVRPSRSCAPEFQPTMRQSSHPYPSAGVRIEDIAQGRNDEIKSDGAFTQEEWERDLDVKLVFKYVMSRFSGRPTSSPPTGGTHGNAATAQDNAAKFSRVRQHHPLIARSRPADRRPFKSTMPVTSSHIRHHSSCASQSTRRSARRSSCSSRHYWDIGGSIGTGSVVASHNPMGSWGEV